VLSHLSFGVADLAKATAFYDGALAALGYARAWSNEDGVGYGVAGGNDRLALFAQAGRPSPPGPGFHLAFEAPSRAAVDAFDAAALVGAMKAPPVPDRITARPTMLPS